jgi:hypothetical protein
MGQFLSGQDRAEPSKKGKNLPKHTHLCRSSEMRLKWMYSGCPNVVFVPKFSPNIDSRLDGTRTTLTILSGQDLGCRASIPIFDRSGPRFLGQNDQICPDLFDLVQAHKSNVKSLMSSGAYLELT